MVAITGVQVSLRIAGHGCHSLLRYHADMNPALDPSSVVLRPSAQSSRALASSEARIDPVAALYATLNRVLDRGGVEALACVSARTAHGIHSVEMKQATLSLVMQGSKCVARVQPGSEAGLRQERVFRQGDLLVMCAGACLDLVHEPDPESGMYQALVVPLCEEVLEAARLVWGGPLRSGEPQSVVGRYAVRTFASSLQAWADALLRGDYPAARAALVLLTVMLCREGMPGLLLPPAQTLVRQIQAHIMQQPARDWQARDFEQALGMSGATLRRRLALEGSGFRALLTDARLACALDLLYSTSLPVKTVAARVGYRSTESFVRAFRMRYGLAPSDIGNTR